MAVVQRTRERFALPALNARTGPRWTRAIRSRRTERGRLALLSMPLFDARRAAEISPGMSLAAFIVPPCPVPDNGTVSVTAEQSEARRHAVCEVDARAASS